MQKPACGFALITALIFLVVLTLVAVIATRSAGLELRMSANSAQFTEAFEASEAPRQITTRLLQALGNNLGSGWPRSIGGSTEDALFAYPIPPAFTIYDASGGSGGTPLNWFEISEADFDASRFIPKARYDETITVQDGPSLRVVADIDVQLMQKSLRPGCELSPGGYDGATCLEYFFLVTSRGQDRSASAAAETATVFRYVPRI
jgi:hypothetical protein